MVHAASPIGHVGYKAPNRSSRPDTTSNTAQRLSRPSRKPVDVSVIVEHQLSPALKLLETAVQPEDAKTAYMGLDAAFKNAKSLGPDANQTVLKTTTQLLKSMEPSRVQQHVKGYEQYYAGRPKFVPTDQLTNALSRQ